MAREEYEIVIKNTGGRELRRNLDDIAGAAQRTTNFFGRMQNAISFAFSVYGLNTLKNYVDGYSNIISKLRIATDTTEEFARAEANLFNISQRTFGGFEETVDLYGRLERSTRELGISQDALLQVTETVNKAIQLSGASVQAANASIIQLGQGLAAGALRGDELRSVLEQTPALAQAISSGMGVAVGDLKKLGEEGELTTQRVLNALAKSTGVIDEEFKNIPMTIGRGWTVLTNAMKRYVGQFDQQFGVSGALSHGLVWVGNNLENIGMAALSASASIALMYAPSVITGIKALGAAIANVWKVVLANPFVAIAAAIATAVTGFLLLKDTITPIEGSFATLGEVAEATYNVMIQKNSALIDATKSTFVSFIADNQRWLTSLSDVGSTIMNTTLQYGRRVLNGFIAIGATIIQLPSTIMGTWERNIDQALSNVTTYFVAFSQDLRAIGQGDFTFSNLDTAREQAQGGFEQMSDDIKDSLKDAFSTDYVGKFGDVLGDTFDAAKGFVVAGLKEIEAESNRLAGVRIENEKKAQAGYEKSDVLLTKEIKTQRQLHDELVKANKARAALLGELQGFEDNYSYERQIEIVELWKFAQLEALKNVGAAHEELSDLIDEVAGKKIEEAYRKSLDASKEWGGGIQRTMLDFAKESENYASLAEGSINSFVDNSVDAIVQFARTGKMSFGDFAAAVAQDILMMTTRMLIMKAVMATIGAFGGGGEVGGATDGISTLGGFQPGGAQYAASGGELRGLGAGTTDSIPVWAANGEFIVNAQATRQHKALLQAINDGKMKRYASGGMVGASGASGGSFEAGGGGKVRIDASQTVIVEGDVSEKNLELVKQAMERNKQETLAEIQRQLTQNGPLRDIIRGAM